jgi:hypothetical protein
LHHDTTHSTGLMDRIRGLVVTSDQLDVFSLISFLHPMLFPLLSEIVYTMFDFSLDC